VLLQLLPSDSAGASQIASAEVFGNLLVPASIVVCVARQVWRSDTGQCVYEEAAAEGAGAGGQMTLLQTAPGGGHALMAATTDCRLRFYASQAHMLTLLLGVQPLSVVKCTNTTGIAAGLNHGALLTVLHTVSRSRYQSH